MLMTSSSATMLLEDPADTASTASETSGAVVSLYNSWSSSEVGSLPDFEDDDALLDRYVLLPREDTAWTSQELLEQLQKRLKKEDLPPVPVLRKRQHPNCLFLNYMGTRTAILPPPRPPSPSIDLGLAEKDALFPLYSSKAKHDEPSQGEKRPQEEAGDQRQARASKVPRVSL